MNILFLTPYLPFPLNNGGNIRTFNLIKNVSKYHNVSLLSLVQQDESEYISEIKKYCDVYPLQYKRNRIEWLKSFFSRYPYITMLKHYSSENEKQIHTIIKNGHFHLLQVESIHMSAYVQNITWIPKVLDAHNIESDILCRICKSTLSIKSIIYCIDYLKNKKFEQNAIRSFDACLSVSENDNKRLRKKGAKRLMTLPNCVDLNYYYPIKRNDFSYNITFTGFMNWYPNVDAVRTFYREAFEKLKKQYPDIKFYIVGKNPRLVIEELQKKEGIIVTGEVPDVRPFISNSDICIVPLRIGGGTRLKILEYFAMEKPIISTSIGAEGIDVINEKHLIIEDDISKFPERIAELLNNPEYAQFIAKNGRKLVEEKYSWEQYGKKLSQLYMELVDDKCL